MPVPRRSRCWPAFAAQLYGRRATLRAARGVAAGRPARTCRRRPPTPAQLRTVALRFCCWAGWSPSTPGSRCARRPHSCGAARPLFTDTSMEQGMGQLRRRRSVALHRDSLLAVFVLVALAAALVVQLRAAVGAHRRPRWRKLDRRKRPSHARLAHSRDLERGAGVEGHRRGRPRGRAAYGPHADGAPARGDEAGEGVYVGRDVVHIGNWHSDRRKRR